VAWKTDFYLVRSRLDVLSTLTALGLGLALVCAALFALAGKTQSVVVAIVGWVIVEIVTAGALGVTIYLDLELLFE